AVGDVELATSARARASLQPHVPGDPAASLPDAPGGAAWGAYSLDLPDIAFTRWLAKVGRTAEDEREEVDDAAIRAAAVVLPFMHGMMGAEPDAVRHRLVLKPRLPVPWARFQVDRITLGDASIALEYQLDGDRHEFRLTQDTGAVPIRVIFEPALPVGTLRRTFIDGHEAELDTRRVGDRIAAPVQIVLDHDRHLQLHGQ
ncbi:MAG TPA: hypothetical protein VNZ57_11940, partial [Longimicrobiales bacterium]|nr:hypothetical protein [Longimicrobiales bacterium]